MTACTRYLTRPNEQARMRVYSPWCKYCTHRWEDHPGLADVLYYTAEFPFERKKPGASCFDLHSYLPEHPKVTLDPGDIARVGTGLRMFVPQGFGVDIRPRSSSSAMGLFVQLGTSDHDYTGELQVVVFNGSRHLRTIQHGDRIAQLLIFPICLPDIEVVGRRPPRLFKLESPDDLPVTDRGSDAFGSTGR